MMNDKSGRLGVHRSSFIVPRFGGPMFELKLLTREAIPAALEKAHRYRLLNEPEQAESICEDVLRLEPDNQEALVTLTLALTDRFDADRPASPDAARKLLPRLTGEYDRE